MPRQNKKTKNTKERKRHTREHILSPVFLCGTLSYGVPSETLLESTSPKSCRSGRTKRSLYFGCGVDGREAAWSFFFTTERPPTWQAADIWDGRASLLDRNLRMLPYADRSGDMGDFADALPERSLDLHGAETEAIWEHRLGMITEKRTGEWRRSDKAMRL